MPEVFLVDGASPFEVAGLVVRPGEGSSRAPGVMLVAERAEALCALVVELLRSHPVASLTNRVGEHEQRKGDAPGVSERSVEFECLLGPDPSRRHVSIRKGHVGGPAESFGAGRRRALIGAERAFETTAAFDQVPSQIPEPPERCGQPKCLAALDRGLEPVQSGSKVGVVAFEPVQPRGVAPRPDEVRLRLLGQREEMVGMATAPP